MSKYIDAEKLKKLIDNLESFSCISEEQDGFYSAISRIIDIIDSLQREQTDMGEVSDGYHTFNELYYYRMLYNAAFFNLLPKEWVHKSKKHHTGEECFGGGWFIVMANLPTGQVSNHYELKDWDLFKVPEKELADEWDGHTPQEAAERLHKYLQQEQNSIQDAELTVFESALFTAFSYAWQSYLMGEEVNVIQWVKENSAELLEAARCQQEQEEVDLERYIENVVNHYGLSLYEASYGTFSACDIDRIIRNAFELGLKARNE